MRLPLYMTSKLIRVQVISHKREIIDTKELYDTLDYACGLLEKWHYEQAEDVGLNDADNNDL